MLRNKKGQSLMAAMGLSALVGLGLISLSHMTISLSQTTRRSGVLARVNNAKAMIELIFKNPASFNCTNNGGVQNGSNSNCRFITGSTNVLSVDQRLQQILGSINASLCPPGNTICGLHIVSGPTLSMDAATQQPQTHLRLEFNDGLDGSYKRPVEIQVPIPTEVIQNASFSCNTMVEGFNPDGSIRCKQLNVNRAPAGQYISGIDPNTFALEISALPTMVSDCTGGDNFLMEYTWEGRNQYTANCGARVDPFLLE